MEYTNQIDKVFDATVNSNLLLTARSNSTESLKFILENHKEALGEIIIDFKSNYNSKVIDFLYSKKCFNFTRIRSSSAYSENTFGIDLTINYSYNTIKLCITLPFSSKKESRRALGEFIRTTNIGLSLKFEDDNQIDREVNELINAFFDNNNHNSNSIVINSRKYNSTGESRRVFEDNKIELSRSVGIQIQIPRYNEDVMTFAEYSKIITEICINHFSNEELEFQSFSRNSTLIENIIAMELVELSSEIEIELSTIKSQVFKSNPDKYFGLKHLSYGIFDCKIPRQEKFTFFVDYIGLEKDDMELHLGIDKYASDQFIELVLNMFENKPNYSHLE